MPPSQKNLIALQAAADGVDSAKETRRRHVLQALKNGASLAEVSRTARIDLGTVRAIRAAASK